MNVQKEVVRPELKRVLRLWDSIAIIVGIVVGAGIFRTPSDVARELGSNFEVLFLWIVGGIIATCGSLTFAELASTWPRTGGMYVYLRECYGPLTSFLYGWTQLLVVRPSVVAGISVVFAEYVAYFIPLPQGGVKLMAVSAILAVSIINYIGVRTSSLVQKIFTSIKIAGIFLLALLGLFFHHSGHPILIEPSAFNLPSISAVGAALILIFWTYDGWSEITMVAGEIQEPQKTIPKALLFGSLGVLFLYILVNGAYLNVLGIEGVASSSRVATDTMIELFGAKGGNIIAGIVLISTFSTLNGIALTGPRIFFAMAVEGDFFSWARKIDPKYRTPSTAIALQAFFAIPLVALWKFEQLATYFVFAAQIFYVLCALSVFHLRQKKIQEGEVYRAWGYPFTPMLFVLVSFGIFVHALITSTPQVMVGFTIMFFGIPIYYLRQKIYFPK